MKTVKRATIGMGHGERMHARVGDTVRVQAFGMCACGVSTCAAREHARTWWPAKEGRVARLAWGSAVGGAPSVIVTLETGDAAIADWVTLTTHEHARCAGRL